MLYEPVTHLTLPWTVPEVQKRCGLCCRLLLFLYFFLTTGFLSVGIYFCHYTVELPLQWYFTEQLLAKARNWKSTQNLQCTGDAATVNHKNDYLNFSAFCFINVYKDRNQTGLNLGICKAIFQQLHSELISFNFISICLPNTLACVSEYPSVSVGWVKWLYLQTSFGILLVWDIQENQRFIGTLLFSHTALCPHCACQQWYFSWTFGLGCFSPLFMLQRAKGRTSESQNRASVGSEWPKLYIFFPKSDVKHNFSVR